MKTTIGIPTYDDPIGLQWTIQDLLIHHDLSDIEIIVVDNHPTHNDHKRPSRETSNIIQYVHGIGGKYIPLIEPVGTAPARNKIFERATGDIIIICDSHIIFGPKTIKTIQNYLEENVLDIVTGPLLKRSLRPDKKGLMIHATHYADLWIREMWGTWAQAWLCPCKQYHFEVRAKSDTQTPEIEIIDGNITSSQYYPQPPSSVYHEMKLGGLEITKCPICDKQIPKTKYHQHIKDLIENEYIPRGWSDIDTEPFEIPGLGLGMFACRKEAWPGFPQEMRGFGGGEMHLHEQFRRNGGKAICLPNAKWWHYFENSPPPYKPQLWDKVRNYIIWRKHLNMPLDPVYNHFVIETKRLTDQQWDYLVEDPIPRKNKPDNLPDPQPIKRQITGATVEQLYDSALKIDRNFEYYFPIIKKLSINKIVSLIRRNHWDIAVLSGNPEHYISYSPIVNDIQENLANTYRIVGTEPKHTIYEYIKHGHEEVEPFKCDILLVDIFGSRQFLDTVFEQWGDYVAKRFIIIGTGIFGDMPENRISKDGGLYHSIIDFTNKGKWKRVYHSKYGLGLTVISKNPAEKSIDMGVGYNLTKLYSSLGIFPKEDCKCKKRNRLMNEIGPEGCLERFNELVADMKTDADKYGWNDRISAGTRAILNGLAFQINPFKPIESLLMVAIRQTQKK